MLHETRFDTPNMTRTDKAGSQQWTAVSGAKTHVATARVSERKDRDEMLRLVSQGRDPTLAAFLVCAP